MGAKLEPEEPPPYWMRDYASIEAHLHSLQASSAALLAELTQSFRPHKDQIDRDMCVPCTPHNKDFRELDYLLRRHQESQTLATSLLEAHAEATQALGDAASEVSQKYGDADVFARARVADIEASLNGKGQPSSGSAVGV